MKSVKKMFGLLLVVVAGCLLQWFNLTMKRHPSVEKKHIIDSTDGSVYKRFNEQINVVVKIQGSRVEKNNVKQEVYLGEENNSSTEQKVSIGQKQNETKQQASLGEINNAKKQQASVEQKNNDTKQQPNLEDKHKIVKEPTNEKNVTEKEEAYTEKKHDAVKLQQTKKTVCPDVLNSMVKGHWKPQNTSATERMEIEQFYKKIRLARNMTENLQRSDKKCGNVGFPKASTWFRALCDRNGDTPCCFNNTCVNRSVEQCKCDECYDLRSSVQAELSEWHSEDTSCQPRSIAVKDTCRMLTGARLFFIGDSLIRQLYTAFFRLIHGSDIMGLLIDRKTPEKKAADIRKACSGLFVLTERICVDSLKRLNVVCNGSLSGMYWAHYRSDFAPKIHEQFLALRNQPKSVIILGIGLHDFLNTTKIQQNVLLPILKIRAEQNLTGPRLLWVTPPSPGLLKYGKGVQGKENVRHFNEKMREFLRKWDVPVFDTFSLTSSVMSLDGTHYGLGINTLEAHIILHYLISQLGDVS